MTVEKCSKDKTNRKKKLYFLTFGRAIGIYNRTAPPSGHKDN